MDALERRGRRAHNLLAGVGRTGQANHTYIRVLDQRLPGRIAAGHNIDDTVGESRRLDQFAQHQGRERGGGGGLEHNRTASGQGRPNLPNRHHQRIVPRCDLADHTHWFAAQHRCVARHIFTGA